jgi:8-oxo-dGTP pyrophosphatase MutT (NUDIX family)
MSPREQAKLELERYLAYFPEEAAVLSALIQQLRTDPEDVFNRKNMRGHITTSAFVLDTAARKALLIHHKLYNRWLQPGGHYEGLEALWQSALREVIEETGAQNPELHPWTKLHSAPFDIDSHSIAEQPKKNEGEHVHHDYVYLISADSTLPLVPQEEEVFDAKWVDIDQLHALQDKRLNRICEKLSAKRIIV